MDDEMHLPWDRQSLEDLLRKVIPTGETSKVDLKRDFELSDVPHQAELLKDISAIANTYNQHYRNHGFVVFGVEQTSLVGCTFPDNEDHVQASIDDLIKKYLGQFITTHLFIFSDADKQWGVLVVPPTRNAPHVFINDVHKRYRGDVYVRNGTMTVKAQPEDYVRFFGQRLEEHTYELRQTVSDL
jgi:predicted HTH transcriptional regulator